MRIYEWSIEPTAREDTGCHCLCPIVHPAERGVCEGEFLPGMVKVAVWYESHIGRGQMPVCLACWELMKRGWKGGSLAQGGS
jgi:hypothetical protein